MVICWVGGGGGGPVPWHNVTCKILFLIYPRPASSIHFFSGRGRLQYPGDSNRKIGRTNENDNPVRKWYKCSSIIKLMFGFH